MHTRVRARARALTVNRPVPRTLTALQPIVFVVVGVGDGPFADLERFDGELGQRLFDNLIFVKLEDVKDACSAARAPLDVGLALAALAELPQAFSECTRLGHFGARDAAGAAAGGGPGKKAAR